MYSIENKSEESRAIQNNSEKHVPTAQFKDNRSQNETEKGMTAQLEKKENLTGMPDNLKEGIESLSGFSMDDVRVHYNSSKPATVQALAYTQGTDIHVAPGQEKHLPHEAWHVAQQMAGRVLPTTNINGMHVNDNAGLEHEADVMGKRAAQCKKGEYNSPFCLKRNNVDFISVQRKIKIGELDITQIMDAINNKYNNNELIKILDENVFSTMPYKIILEFFQNETDKGSLKNFDTTFKQWFFDWEAFEEGTYEYTNDETGLFKLVKDVFKYHFFTKYGWRIIGVGEYMTGDATGLGIAADIDPTITLKILPYWAPQTKKTPTFMEGGALDPKKIDTRFENSTRREDSLAKEHAPVLFRPLYDSSQVRISRTGLNKWETTYADFKEKKKKKMLSQEYSKDEKIVDDLKSLSASDDIDKLREKIVGAKINEELKNQQQRINDIHQNELQQQERKEQKKLQQQIKEISQEVQKLQKQQQEREKQKGLQQELQQEKEKLQQEKEKLQQEKEKLQQEKEKLQQELRKIKEKLPKLEQIVVVSFENDVVANALCCTKLTEVNNSVKETEYTKEFYNKSKEVIKNALISIKLETLSLNESQNKEIEDEFKLVDPRNADVIYKRRFVAEGRSDKAEPIKPWNKETYEATQIIGEKYKEKKEEIKPLLLPSDETVKKRVKLFKNWLFAKNDIGKNKECILLWQRRSGERGGAHKELDSHPIILKRIAKMISDNFSDRVIILIGDESICGADLGITSKTADFHEYWNLQMYKNLGLNNDRNNQNYFLQLLSDENDAISIGMRSGSLESSALLGIKTIFIDDLGNNAEDRMEFWAGNAAYGREHHLIDESFERNLSGPIPNYKRLATSNCFTTSERYIFPYLDAIEQLAQNYCNYDKCLFFDEAKVVEKLGSIFESLKKDIENIKIQCSQIADYLEKIREGQEFIRIGEKFIRIGLNEVGRAFINNGQIKIKIKKPYEISMLRRDENSAYFCASQALEKLYKELHDELWENHDINKTKGDILGKINEFRKYMEEWVISDNELDQLAGLLSFWINSEKEPAAEGTDKESRS